MGEVKRLTITMTDSDGKEVYRTWQVEDSERPWTNALLVFGVEQELPSGDKLGLSLWDFPLDQRTAEFILRQDAGA